MSSAADPTRQVTFTSEVSLSADGFIEFTFDSVEDIQRTVQVAAGIRARLRTLVAEKILGNDIADASNALRKCIVSFYKQMTSFA